MPEYFDTYKNKKIIPDETFILVGYCKYTQNIIWYKKLSLMTIYEIV
jgi:hypothetical protein